MNKYGILNSSIAKVLGRSGAIQIKSALATADFLCRMA